MALGELAMPDTNTLLSDGPCPSEAHSGGEHHGSTDAFSDGMYESDLSVLLPEDQYSSDCDAVDADYVA